MTTLKIKPGRKDEVGEDIFRVHSKDRGNIKSQSLCIVKNLSNKKKAYSIVRGSEYCGIAEVDEYLREKLEVENDKEYQFEIKNAIPIWGWFRWSWNATNIAYRISARISLASLALGAIALLTTVC